MKRVTIKQKYNAGGSSVFLTIRFGHAQMGTSRLLLDGEFFKFGHFVDFELGVLTGRLLSIKTTATDISNETDVLDVEYALRGGPVPLEFGLQAIAEAPGASVEFNAEIELS